MKDLYRVRFTIQAKEGNTLNLEGVLAERIRKWVERKFGNKAVASIVPDWSAFLLGATFGNPDTVGEFYSETVSARNCWACRITEFPRYNHKYIPRKWVTEIGVCIHSDIEWDVSYSVRYVDLAGYSGLKQSRPKLNIPNIAKQLLSSEEWDCTSNGEPLEADITHYKAFDGDLFGIADCIAIAEQGENLEPFQTNTSIRREGTHTVSDLKKLAKQEIEYLCQQMSPKKIRAYFQKYPKDFTKIRPGFRPNALPDADAINILIRNSDKPFIWSFIDDTVKRWIGEIADYRKEKEQNGSSAEEALLLAIPQSVFADNVELYLALCGEDYSSDYVLLLKSAATLLKKAVLLPTPGDSIVVSKEVEEKIEELTKKNEQLQVDLDTEKFAHTNTIQVLAGATAHNAFLQQSLTSAESRIDVAATRIVQMQEELELLRKLAKYADSDADDASSDTEYEYTSICQVYSDHYSCQTWLIRLADIHSGKISRFTRIEDMPYYFDNRDRLFWRDGPRDEGYVGIWHWNAVPNKNDPATDYVTTSFAKYGKIIEIVEFPDCHTYEEIVKYLSEKSIPHSQGRKYFFALSGSKGNIQGLLCNENDLDIENGSAKLKSSTSVLPRYVISTADIITIAGKNYYRFTNMGMPQDIYHVKSPFAVVKDVVVSRATSAVLRQQGITKKEAQHCRLFLMDLPVTTIAQEIADGYGCTETEATEYLTQFLVLAETYLDENDLDVGTLSAALSRNPDMVDKCKQLLEAEWRSENEAMLKEAIAVRDRVEQETTRLGSQVQELKGNIAGLLTQVDEIESQITAKLQLATDVETKVAERIAAARANAADFICEMAFAGNRELPATKTETDTKRVVSIRHHAQCKYGGTIDDIDMLEEELACNFDALGYNATSANQMAQIVTFCICNRQPILCGSNASAIADAISVLLHSKGAYEITLPMASDRCNELCEALGAECAEENAVILLNGVFDGYSMNAYTTVMQYASQWNNHSVLLLSISGIDPASIPSAVWDDVWFIDGDMGLTQFPHGLLNGFDIACELVLEFEETLLKVERRKLKQFSGVLSNRAVLNYAGYLVASGSELKKNDLLILQLLIQAKAQNQDDEMITLLKSAGIDLAANKLLSRYI